MKLIGIVLLFSVGAVLTNGCINECSLSDLSSLNSLMKSVADMSLKNCKLTCSSVHERTAYATCPGGSLAVACSCGSACGSWDIISESTCHCQCENMDWTTARCCLMDTTST